MKKLNIWIICTIVFGISTILNVQAQYLQSDYINSNINNSIQALNQGDGYMVAGDYWVTVKPMNTPYDGRLGSPFVNIAGGSNNYILLGGAGNWADPAGNWPSGFRYVNNFRNSPRIFFSLFKKNGWPGFVPGNPFRAADLSTDMKGTSSSSRFMFATFSEGLAAAKDPNRNYRRDARFTDATRRHMIYEAGWPTTAGVDFKMRAHQFTVNEQNMNDFVLIEITLINTGNVDTNADGTFEATNNRIDGITLGRAADISPTIEISASGDRGCNCINAGRSFGYSFAPNPYDDMNPMGLWMWYANTPTTLTQGQSVPPSGLRQFGIDNHNQLMGYTDIWNTWNVIAVKKGSISDTNLNSLTGSSINKETVFGTHPIGDGARKGWFTSVQWQSQLGSRIASDIAFRNSMATWFEDYGKTTNSPSNVKLNPNPAFFSSGTPDDITTWTVGNPNARPNGDYKYASTDIGRSSKETPVWEPLWNPGAANGSDFYAAQGFTKEYTFGQFLNHGVGPFSLEPGESMTIVWVSAAGFRLDGLLRTMQAAEWSYKQGMSNAANALPVPAIPDIRVSSTPIGTSKIEWTDVSYIPGGTVSGYKIWRSSFEKRTRYEDLGLRIVDNYHRQHDVGASIDLLKKPVNSLFDYWSIFATETQGTYQPTEWGHYDLIAKITNAQLDQHTNGAGLGYNFAFIDANSIVGNTYWYYVSAYREGQFSGPQGPVPVGHIESSNMNRNGRNGYGASHGQIGLASPWGGTYPWAVNNANFPQNDAAKLKNLGVPFTTTSLIPKVSTVAVTQIGATTATVAGNVTEGGNAPVSSRGACYSISQNPFNLDNCVSILGGTGEFVVSVSSLTPTTTYYARTFATNSYGTGYGSVLMFQTGTTFTIDDNGIIKCNDAIAGSKGTIFGDVYEAVDRSMLMQRRDEGADLTKVCTSLVTDMSHLFNGTVFNQQIGNWDVSNVTNMASIFQNSTFNRPISKWDVRNVTNMASMFNSSPFNQSIDNWDVSNVTDMGGMFLNTQFNQPLNNWDVRKVTSMSAMFSNSLFNHPLSNWMVRNVVNMNYMFQDSEFNQPIGNWDVRNVTNMQRMFNASNTLKPTPFNQEINEWNVSKVKNMDYMFRNSSFNRTINNWCVASIKNEPVEFSLNGQLANPNKPKWGTCPIQKVIQLQPASNSVNVTRNPIFSWNKDVNSTSYQLQVFEGVDPIVLDTLVSSLGFILNVQLKPSVVYFWRIRGINEPTQTNGEWSEVWRFTTGLTTSLESESKPTSLKLEQNFPNPFNPVTQIQFTLSTSSNVKLEIFDLVGRSVSVLLNEYAYAGTHSMVFNGSSLSSGVYLYRLTTPDQVLTKSMTLIK